MVSKPPSKLAINVKKKSVDKCIKHLSINQQPHFFLSQGISYLTINNFTWDQFKANNDKKSLK